MYEIKFKFIYNQKYNIRIKYRRHDQTQPATEWHYFYSLGGAYQFDN